MKLLPCENCAYILGEFVCCFLYITRGIVQYVYPWVTHPCTNPVNPSLLRTFTHTFGVTILALTFGCEVNIREREGGGLARMTRRPLKFWSKICGFFPKRIFFFIFSIEFWHFTHTVVSWLKFHPSHAFLLFSFSMIFTVERNMHIVSLIYIFFTCISYAGHENVLS